MDRWHIDGKVMFGRQYLIVQDEATSIGWALLGTDRKDLLVEYMRHKTARGGARAQASGVRRDTRR